MKNRLILLAGSLLALSAAGCSLLSVKTQQRGGSGPPQPTGDVLLDYAIQVANDFIIVLAIIWHRYVFHKKLQALAAPVVNS